MWWIHSTITSKLQSRCVDINSCEGFTCESCVYLTVHQHNRPAALFSNKFLCLRQRWVALETTSAPGVYHYYGEMTKKHTIKYQPSLVGGASGGILSRIIGCHQVAARQRLPFNSFCSWCLVKLVRWCVNCFLCSHSGPQWLPVTLQPWCSAGLLFSRCQFWAENPHKVPPCH